MSQHAVLTVSCQRQVTKVVGMWEHTNCMSMLYQDMSGLFSRTHRKAPIMFKVVSWFVKHAVSHEAVFFFW